MCGSKWVKVKARNAFMRASWPNCFRSGIMTARQLASFEISNCNGQQQCRGGILDQFLGIVGSYFDCGVRLRTNRNASQTADELFEGVCLECWAQTGALGQVSLGVQWQVSSSVRLDPQTMTMLVLLEQHKGLYGLFVVMR